tara:strand:+ start:522 stop:746 length:225 start_codon:yes stop_codon:yes gene_type:complete
MEMRGCPNRSTLHSHAYHEKPFGFFLLEENDDVRTHFADVAQGLGQALLGELSFGVEYSCLPEQGCWPISFMVR